MDKEFLELILTNAPKVENFEWVNHDAFGFSRTCIFETRGKKYEIVWYGNESYLYVDDLEIRFNDITVNGSWPNRFKTNLNFYLHGKKVAVLPIEEYQKD